MKIARISENTLVIYGEQIINNENLHHIRSVLCIAEKELQDVIIDIIPAYASIHITFNVLAISASELTKKLHYIIETINHTPQEEPASNIINIPVYYGEEVALDLLSLAKNSQLLVEDVIRIHSEKLYDVYAIGFSPGFAYLGNVDERIASPRKSTPRKKVAQGSVGIADQQTAVYPSASPGGWQIIGRTPLPLVDYSHQPFTPFSVGDKVNFTPISKAEYTALGGEYS